MDRRTTALNERTPVPDVQAHITPDMPSTTEQRVDAALRASLVADVPMDLSARLLMLANPAPAPQLSRFDRAIQGAVVMQAPPELVKRLELLVPREAAVAPARNRWIWPIYAITAMLCGVLLVVAAQVYGFALQELGVAEFWLGLTQLPGQWLTQLYTYFPQGRYVVEAFFSLQRALQWVLIGLVMWMVLEMRTPQRWRNPVRASAAVGSR